MYQERESWVNYSPWFSQRCNNWKDFHHNHPILKTFLVYNNYQDMKIFAYPCMGDI